MKSVLMAITFTLFSHSVFAGGFNCIPKSDMDEAILRVLNLPQYSKNIHVLSVSAKNCGLDVAAISGVIDWCNIGGLSLMIRGQDDFSVLETANKKPIRLKCDSNPIGEES